MPRLRRLRSSYKGEEKRLLSRCCSSCTDLVNNVDLILINPRVIAKSKCQNVITNPPVIASSNQPKPKDLEASKSNVYYWLLLLWAMTTGAQLMDLYTLNYGGLGPHPRGGGGGGGGFLL